MLNQHYVAYPGEFTRVLENARRFVREWLPQHGKILDVGSGRQYISRLLDELQRDVTVLSVEPDQRLSDISLLAANSLTHVQCVPLCMRIDQMPACRTFDAIIVHRAIHEVAPARERPGVLADAIEKFLKPGGTIILSDPFFTTDKEDQVAHAQRIMRELIGHTHDYAELAPPETLTSFLSERFQTVLLEETEDELSEATGGLLRTYWLMAR